MTDKIIPFFPDGVSNKEAPANVLKQFTQYLAKRGIGHRFGVANKLTLVPYSQASEYLPNGKWLLRHMDWGILVPYHDMEGTPINYMGVRALPKLSASFSAEVGTRKFIVPAGQPRLYFPLTNPSPEGLRCVITESAIKAIVASFCGFYAIGLNGCWGFSRKGNKGLLDDFHDVPWSAFKDVVYCTDSDWVDNTKVAASVTRFADLMHQTFGLTVRHLQLPHAVCDDGATEKQGLDDFMGAKGHTECAEFLGSEPAKIELSEFSLAMVDLNEACCYAEQPNVFVNLDGNYTMTDKHFHNMYANRRYRDSEGNLKQASRVWLQWDGCNRVVSVVNKPGEEMYVGDNYNIWRPSDVEPVKGDVSTHLTFLRRALPSESERAWFQKWVAHLVQNPGIKMATSLVLYSMEEGTGKTMLAETISYMLGKRNTARISQEIFRGQFNGGYATKQLVVINESSMDGAGVGQMMEKLKSFVTEETVQVREMRTNPYEIENYCHVILTSNHLNALRISPTDRRFAVFEFNSQFRHSQVAEEWGVKCWRWHREHIQELLYYYMNDVNCSEFDPHGPAPDTNAKEEMKVAALSEFELFAHRLATDREATLEEYGFRKNLRYMRIDDLVAILCPDSRNPQGDRTRIGAALKKFGFGKYRGRVKGKQVMMQDLKPDSPTDCLAFEHDYISPRGKKFDG